MIESILALGLLLGPALSGVEGPVPGDDAADPAPKKQEEKPPAPPPEAPAAATAAALEDQGLPWIDFDWLEIQPRVGLALFTEDYHIDPSPYFSLLAHVPIPLLSPGSDAEGDYFGLFAEVSFLPRVTRDLEPEPDKVSGSILFFNLGFDFTFLRDQSLYLAARAGAQFAWYGGIDDLNDGFGYMAGFEGGLHLGKGLTLTVGPEVNFGDGGDRVYLAFLGLLIEF